MKIRIKPLAVALAAVFSAGAPIVAPVSAPGVAAAQSVVSTGESFVHAELVPGRAEPDGSRMAGLILDLAPEWKTYWRNPGAAGVPPRFDWSRSRNLAGAEVLWPRPAFFDSYGLTTIGYAKRVVFPLHLVPEMAGQPMDVALDLAIGVCREICVLEEVALSLSLPPGAPDDGAALVAAAEAQVPRPGTEQGLTEAICRVAGAGKKRTFDATLDFGRALPEATVILEGPEMAWFSDVETAEQDGRLQVTARLSLLDESVWIDRSALRMTVLGPDIAADIKGCNAPAG